MSALDNLSKSLAALLQKALFAVDPIKAVEVIVLFFLVQEIEGNVVQPLVMSRSVHVVPLLVIVSIRIGISLPGVIGTILAVPIAAGIQVLVVRVLAPVLRHMSTPAASSSPPSRLLRRRPPPLRRFQRRERKEAKMAMAS